MLAANTSFADFPRLGSLLARDRFLPRQFATRGDKLVFSNGIVMLAIFFQRSRNCLLGRHEPPDSSLRSRRLSSLSRYLSQEWSATGSKCVRSRRRERLKSRKRREEDIHYTQSTVDRDTLPDAELEASDQRGSTFVNDEVTDSTHWKKSIVVNAVGAVATFIVLCVFIATKFIHGAWIVVVVIPLLVLHVSRHSQTLM